MSQIARVGNPLYTYIQMVKATKIHLYWMRKRQAEKLACPLLSFSHLWFYCWNMQPLGVKISKRNI